MRSDGQLFTLNIGSEDQHSSSSSDSLLNSNIQELQRAFDNFQKFKNQLSPDKDESIEKEIIEYSGKEEALFKSSEEISKLCQKRIQKHFLFLFRMLRNKKTKKNWNQDDIDILVWVLNRYGAYYAKKSVHQFVNFILTKNEDDWKFLSSLIPATSWKKCMFKWLSLKKFSLLTFRWSNQESEILSELIQQNGKNDWKKLAEKLYLNNSSKQRIFRTAKQCRQHWNCYLNPAIKKGPWSVKEDIRLLENVLQLNCLKKWSEVAKKIKGRTQNAVKNRFSLLLDKQRKKTSEHNEKNLINRVLVKLMHQQTSEHGQIKSEEIKQIDVPNQIFEESECFMNDANLQQKGQLNVQKKTEVAESNEKKDEKCKLKVIIPTVIPNQTFYQQPQYFPICPDFNPYLFRMMYGGHYQMN